MPISRTGNSAGCSSNCYSRGTDAQTGFTLIEVILVLALVAVLALALSPLLAPSPSRTLRDTGREVMVALREARRMARSAGSVQQFVLDAKGHRYRTGKHGRWTEVPAQITLELTTAAELSPEEGKGAILFYPNGSSTGGRVTLGAAGQAIDLDVEWLTGRVRMSWIEPE